MILFFYGPNTYAARQQIAKLITEYEAKSGSTFGLERIDGAKAKPEELRGALMAVPFLANSRLVIVENLGGNKALAGNINIKKLISDIPTSTVAVFYDPAVDQRTSYFKTLSVQAKAVKFDLLPAAKLQQWIAAEAKRHDADIARPAAVRLLELAGEDQWRLSNEIAKLSSYRNPITVEAVNEQIEETHAETIFSLVEAMTSGRVDEALQLFQHLRASGQNEMYMLSMVVWQLRNLLLAKTAGKISSAELAKAAGMSPFVAGKMLAKRHVFAEQVLKDAFLQAVETDYHIKTGEGKPDVLVEQLIYRIAGMVVA